LHAVATVGARVGAGASPAARAAAIARLLGDGVAAKQHAQAQCDQSRHLAQWIGASEAVVAALAFICERFDGRGSPEGAAGEAIPIATRLYHVADVAELALDRVGRAQVGDVLARRAGGALDPGLCRVLLRELDRLLDALEGPDVFARYLAAEPEPHELADEDRLDRITEALGRFVDVKSVFFAGHSDGVARLAEGAAHELGLRAPVTRSLVRAAHLHDLGRLSVPNRVWDKPGPLGFAEREQVRLHAYYTDRILAQTPALRTEARIASSAHERLDGRGYHRALEAAGLSPEARLLAVADVAQAMRERRPHREALEVARLKGELSALARRGALDAASVDAVIAVIEAPSDRPRRTLRARASLSERELEVLRLVAAGKTNKEIAVILDLSAKTVQHHVAHVYAKIGVYSRAGATLYVIEQGLSG
jgi:HD-GYP domain-containing protein (c-di-GMP phosphodiesterase class II)